MRMTLRSCFRLTTVALVFSGGFATLNLPGPNLAAQDYPNSVASTDFDYIHESDPSTFKALEYVGKFGSEMPDKREGREQLIHPAFVFVATFTDGCSTQLSIDQAFENKEAAETEANRYVHRLGKLPTSLRQGVDRVVVHKGGRDTTAFSDVGLIVLYSDNASKRISNHDLEETVFHESVHASWDKKHANSEAWKKAQAQDGSFVTSYAKRKPAREDLAESALFAYTLIHHPGRIPAADAKKIKKAIPARIRFVAELVPPGKSIFYDVDKKKIVPTRLDAPRDAESKKKPKTVAVKNVKCKIDIMLSGQLGDLLSNALLRSFNKDEKAVRSFLDTAQKKAENSEALFQMTLKEFDLKEADLKAKISEYLHCNCEHESDPESDERAKKLIDSWKAAVQE
ncbi:MAG: hypothetical protein AB8B55_24120 [Mariniblastus sp.]